MAVNAVYTVTFDSQGGISVPSQNVENGYNATEPPTTPTRTGYTFEGWFNDTVIYDFATPVTSDLTLIAHWTPKISVTVSDANLIAPNTYLTTCGTTSIKVVIAPEDPAIGVIYNGAPTTDFIVNTSTIGMYLINYTVQTSTDTFDYNLTVESPIPFDSIVTTRYDNLLIVNCNPEFNGGHTFSTFEWYKNGTKITDYNKPYYSADPINGTKLDANDKYSVTLTTEDNTMMHTCEGKATLTPNALLAYPNPVPQGKQFIVDGIPEEVKSIHIYDLSGNLVDIHPVEAGSAYPIMPYASGMYLIQIGGKTIKILVE
ncbi:hypothetical protein FACS1894199_15120 [Bacteroidia bacterium]|nr:hypothetical protein FACS1894199_15120 [Bacteroidia bacterium]